MNQSTAPYTYTVGEVIDMLQKFDRRDKCRIVVRDVITGVDEAKDDDGNIELVDVFRDDLVLNIESIVPATDRCEAVFETYEVE